MTEFVRNDINRGYVQFIKSISLGTRVNGSGFFKLLIFYLNMLSKNFFRLFMIPLLFLYGIFLIFILKLHLLFFNKNTNPSTLHANAINYITEFISQYPMHLYPILAKSMELAFIMENFDKIPVDARGGIIELAIGEGSLSQRIFSNRNINIVGLDLNPYSLIHVKSYKHISRSIIADCMNPPIRPCGASFVICNNFLHHVAHKEYNLQNWSKIAPYALFNENTVYWSSGWFIPYLLKSFGLRNAAKKVADRIEKFSLQALWSQSDLNILVRKYFDIIEEKSFLHERTFFFCSICSFLLFCYGPPTPKLPKKLLTNKLFWPITKSITYFMAKILIEYDALLPRNKDAFIHWVVKSKSISNKCLPKEIVFACPDCHAILEGNKCNVCNKMFNEYDGMLFLLPKELASEIVYTQSKENFLNREHL